MATYNNISSIKIGNDTFNFKIGETSTDTKNTAGATDTSNKIYLIGATSQSAEPQTYSHDTAYIGTDGHLYSNGIQVVNLSGSQSLTNKTYNGYTLAAACAKNVDASISSGSTSTNLPTSSAVATFVEGKGYLTNDDINLGTAASKDYTTSVTSNSSNLVTSGAVYTAINNIPSGITDVQAPYSSTSAVSKVSNNVATLNVASTSYYGLTKLSDSTSSTSTSLAATPSAVKQAYDLANTASSNASSALSTANTASSTASTASTNASTALTKANSAYDKGIEFVASGTYSSGVIGGKISDSSLTSGKVYVVKMGAATTATNHSIRFQNSSGTNLTSYPLYAYGTTRSNQIYPSGTVLMFVYYSSAFYLINPFALTT